MKLELATLFALIASVGIAFSQEKNVPDAESIRGAIDKALPLIEAGSRGSANERSCYTCHNQGLPILTFIEARSRGFEIDEDNLQRQINHTAKHLKRGKKNYETGNGQGGRADTAGSALWALYTGGKEPDEITDAVAGFLLRYNGDTPYWQAQSNRPPSEGSRFTSTFLALYGLDAYGRNLKNEAIEKRRETAREWLIKTPAKTTEDAVFRLWALSLAKAEEVHLGEAAKKLRRLQRDDGGWAQLADSEGSDAYATGSALVALHKTKQSSADSPEFLRGLKYLIDTQFDDGTWHVVSRSRPIQEFYETGFPHGEDQFISASGTAWAALALLQSIDPVEGK